jgi:hypothetical protein
VEYQLSFLDDLGRVREIRQARFHCERDAMRWMWIAGGVSALAGRWSAMELRNQGRCAVRIPAQSLIRDAKAGGRAKPCVLIVDSEPFGALNDEVLAGTAGYSIAEFFFDDQAAVKWLSAHRPDAAIIEARPADPSCARLGKILCEKQIPFLAVSHLSAVSPGIDPILRAAPWFEKPGTAASLHLALGCIL